MRKTSETNENESIRKGVPNWSPAIIKQIYGNASRKKRSFWFVHWCLWFKRSKRPYGQHSIAYCLRYLSIHNTISIVFFCKKKFLILLQHRNFLNVRFVLLWSDDLISNWKWYAIEFGEKQKKKQTFHGDSSLNSVFVHFISLLSFYESSKNH